MQQWKIWTGILTVFCLGAAAGALGMQSYIKRTIMADFRPPREPSAENIISHIDREVGLREEQKRAMTPLFAAMVKKIGENMRESHQKIEIVVAETDTAVAALLDAAQKDRFLELVARMKKMRDSMPPFGGAPPPGGPHGPPPFGGPPPPEGAQLPRSPQAPRP